MVDMNYNNWAKDFPWTLVDENSTEPEEENCSFFDDLCEWAPGWVEPAYEFCQTVDKLLKETPNSRIYIMQFKEKYGEFRLYYNATTNIYDAIEDALRKCEQACSKRCIKCGAPATTMTKGWITYVCDKHAKRT